MSGSPRDLRNACMAALAALALSATLLTACKREVAEQASQPQVRKEQTRARAGVVTVSGDDAVAAELNWHAPPVSIAPDGVAKARKQAEAALVAGKLYADADSAIPLYLALAKAAPDDARVKAGLQHARTALIARGDAALAKADHDIEALRTAHTVAAVARALDGDDPGVQAYLARVDAADTLWELNRQGEQELAEGKFGEQGGGAVAKFRQALALRPGQARAMQGFAAAESAMIRSAEIAAGRNDFSTAKRWLDDAAKLRPDMSTVSDARARIERIRSARIAGLRDVGMVALLRPGGIADARARLAEILQIAKPGDPMAAELRERIDLAEHYGLFRPGQSFTDELKNGARGPQMMVLPHGAFRMGAADGDQAGVDKHSLANERPVHNVHFTRGFAISVTEVTVGDFRKFILASGYRTRAERRGYSMVYDPRSGNFTRHSGVDWQTDYLGHIAAADLPVLHVSAADADAYAQWLSELSGHQYRVPSEAEFEYVLRAGNDGLYPWGNGAPPVRAGNFTGALDRSPDGRSWANAFPGYGDGAWGPAPVASYHANKWGVHDMVGNVSEWVADCWHDGYRRAPVDGSAWFNPGCRTRVIRGGSWSSSPEQTRSAWRAPAGVDNTNASVGFRVARDI